MIHMSHINEQFQLGLSYILVCDDYGKIPSAAHFYGYCQMDEASIRRFSGKLVESMLGYYHSLSAFMQGMFYLNRKK